MLSLKKIKEIELQPSLFETETMPILEAVNDEEGMDLQPEPELDYYIPKLSYKQFFENRAAGIGDGSWTNQVKNLQDFFDTATLPEAIQLNSWTYISNVKQFVTNHMQIVKRYNGNKRFENYLRRLQDLKIKLNQESHIIIVNI